MLRLVEFGHGHDVIAQGVCQLRLGEDVFQHDAEAARFLAMWLGVSVRRLVGSGFPASPPELSETEPPPMSIRDHSKLRSEIQGSNPRPTNRV